MFNLKKIMLLLVIENRRIDIVKNVEEAETNGPLPFKYLATEELVTFTLKEKDRVSGACLCVREDLLKFTVQ